MNIDHGPKSEERVLKLLGLEPVRGSGCGAYNKGDGEGKILKTEVLLECKSTIKKSFKIDLGVLKKIISEARSKSRVPVFSISFVEESGKAVESGDWLMIPMDYLWEFDNE